MNGFQCNVTGSTSDVPLAKPKVARRCGADPDNKKLQSVPANCTYGAKAPFYWFQAERNNMFEGTFSPPVYNDLYNFLDGSQDDIFEDSYLSIPDPSPNAALPVLNGTNETPLTINGIPSPGEPSSSSSNSSSSTPSASPSSTPSLGSAATNSSSNATPSSPAYNYRRDLHSPMRYRRDLRRYGHSAFSERSNKRRQHRLRNVVGIY